MKILGIDPGYGRIGIAVIEKPSPREKERLLHSECFTTSAKTEIYERLSAVGARVKAVIEKYKPDALAMETLFITKNQKTAMHVAETRGIIAYEARTHDMPIFEYSPPQIKVAVTGHGKSDKTQVTKMIHLLMRLPPEKERAGMIDDEYDAIAVALTCLASEAK